MGEMTVVDFETEYIDFIQRYLFPLLGIVDGRLKQYNLQQDDIIKPSSLKDSIYYSQKTKKYIFSAMKKAVAVFDSDYRLDVDDEKLAKNIIAAFLSLSEYRLRGNSERGRTLSEVQKDSLYRMAVQKGICDWIIGANNPYAELLMCKLERWAVQTYEGKKVSFGFIIDGSISMPSDTNNLNETSLNGNLAFGNWLDFMDSDYAAVLTDCIHSVVKLDRNCNFIEYLSLSNNGYIPRCTPTDYVPLRFANVIQQYVTNSKVGIFLLVNGDIIIAKHSKIKLIKRNLKWLNFSYAALENAVKNSSCTFFNDSNEPGCSQSPSLLSAIYASILDVSLSHTGGIISVVDSKYIATESDLPAKERFSEILAKSDMLIDDIDLNIIHNEFDERSIQDNERRKRLLKRSMLYSLVNKKNFIQIDRKLRNELIALDGACIIDQTGRVISFGAIIRNEKGSSEGGRGAAAKSLSQFGMAVKISTDGYIELFVSGEEKPSYTIK